MLKNNLKKGDEVIMQVLDIYNFLNEIAPVNTALDFDNVGILVGDPQKAVKKVVVCLDCTPQVVKMAVSKSAELIITHHPVIFEPLKSVVKSESNVVYDCLVNGISVISMHTNLDSSVGGVNDCLARILELENVTVEVVKKAEKSDALILRMVERDGNYGKCTLRLKKSAQVSECTLMEWHDLKDVALDDNNTFTLDFRAFEIKTIKIS